ncbi:MAG: GtrA family protein [Patescibacteria group bacterium]
MTSLIFRSYEYCLKNFGLLLRYGIAGGSGVIANLIVFSFLVEYLKLWYVYGAVFGFVAAYVVTFSLHKWWTFTATSHKRTVTQGTLYLTSALLGLGLTISILTLLVDGLGFWPVIAQFMALGAVAVLSFIFTSQITFHAEEERWHRLHEASALVVRVLSTQHRFWISLLTIIMVGIASVRLALVTVTINSDTLGYASTAQQLLGEEVVFNGARYLKPLAPAVIAALTPLGIDPVSGVLVQSVLLYFALGLAAYWFGYVLFAKKSAGFLSAVFIVGSFPIVKYGLDYFTETGAWALYFLSLAGMILWYRNPQSYWHWFVAGTLLAGLLWKEYAVLAGLTFLFVICFHTRVTVVQKVLVLMQVGALTLIPWVMWQYHVYTAFSYSYLDWMKVGAAPEAYATMYTVPAVIKSTFVLLGAGWLLVLYGLLRWKKITPEIKYFILTMTLPAFGFLLWGYVSSRLFFSLVPLAVVFAIVGTLRIKSKPVQTGMVLFYIITSFGLVWLSFVPDIRVLIDTITYGIK